MAGRLDTGQRAWAIGAVRPARPAGLPEEPGDPVQVLEQADSAGRFPIGPFLYGTYPVTTTTEPPHHVVRLDMPHGDGSPFITADIELGPYGFVALAGTRSGRFIDGANDASHMLLADVEAGLSDLFVFAEIRCAQLGYRGPMEGILVMYSDVPGEPLGLRCLDEVTGQMIPEPEHHEFAPLRFEFESGSLDLGHDAAYRVSEEVAQRFGAPGPQLLLPTLDPA